MELDPKACAELFESAGIDGEVQFDPDEIMDVEAEEKDAVPPTPAVEGGYRRAPMVTYLD